MQPFEIPFSLTTDSSGNGTYTQKFQNDFWYSVTISADGAGPGGKWTISKNGVFLLPGVGPSIALGPITSSPGSQIVVAISGAVPNTTITGLFWGMNDPSPVSLPMQTGGNTSVQTSVTQPKQKLYPDGVAIPTDPTIPSIIVPSNTSLSRTFTLPPGTVAIRLLVNALGNAFSYNLLVEGQSTLEQYFGDPGAPGSALTVPVPSLPFTIPVERDWDSTVFIQVGNTTLTIDIHVYVSAIFAFESPGQAGASQSVNIINGNVRTQSPDWQLFNHAVNPNPAASSVSGTNGNARALANVITWTVAANAGRTFNGRVFDGATQIGGVVIGTNGAAAGPTSVSVSLVGNVSSPGQQLKADFDFGPAAGEQQSVSGTGWFVT